MSASDAGLARYRSALASALGAPFFEGNQIDILRNGVEIFPAMLAAIDAARDSIDFLTYVYWTGEMASHFAKSLSAAARRGVAVRVLLDGIGAFPMERALISQLQEAGVDLRWFRPPRRWVLPWEMTHRTHRKVLVCDQAVGFTGGVGIGEEWEGDAREPGEWRETHFCLQGPALQGLQAAFVGNWLEVAPEDDHLSGSEPPAPQGTMAVQVIRSSAAIAWSDMATLLHTLLRMADHSIRISTPYFVPSEPIVRRLIGAAEAGIDVAILVPGPHIDYRMAQVAGEDWYEDLLTAGVTISEYLPTMIHQKIAVVDHCIVSIGSGNLNHRSLHQDDEVQLVVADRGFAERIDALLDEDWLKSRPLSPERWRRRGWTQRVAETVTRPFRQQF